MTGKIKIRMMELEPCPICGKDKPTHLITCSPECAAKKNRKVNWTKYDSVLKDCVNRKLPWTHLAKKFGISDVGVKKRARKLGLI